MKYLSLTLILITVLIAASKGPALKGTYKYIGGIYNGKTEQGNKGYQLQRKYNDLTFNAFILEDKQPPYKYQTGSYNLTADSCFETETFSAQPSKLTGKTIHYHYLIVKDTLKLSGVLPNGSRVEEHWLKTGK